MQQLFSQVLSKQLRQVKILETTHWPCLSAGIGKDQTQVCSFSWSCNQKFQFVFNNAYLSKLFQLPVSCCMALWPSEYNLAVHLALCILLVLSKLAL